MVTREDDEHVDERVGRLRGPEVHVDVRRTTRIVVGVGIAVVLVLAVVLFVVALNQNSEVKGLQQRGAPVDVTVSACIGNASGSGSTAAGYTCTGSFTFRDRRYVETIGGLTSFVAPGTVVAGVTDPLDPHVVFTAHSVATTRDSAAAFVAPILLAVLLVGSIVVLVVVRRRRPGPAPTS
jgi:hypothetical protein